MIYAYSNNGMTCAAQPDGYTAASGEVLFTHVPAAEELEAAFPGYTTAVAAAATTASRDAIIAQLAELDPEMPRVFEDCIAAYNWDITKLPQVQQDRFHQKQALRAQLAAVK